MGSKTRLSSYCTKRANNGVNLATSRKIITRLARPMFGHVQNVTTACDSLPIFRIVIDGIAGFHTTRCRYDVGGEGGNRKLKIVWCEAALYLDLNMFDLINMNGSFYLLVAIPSVLFAFLLYLGI